MHYNRIFLFTLLAGMLLFCVCGRGNKTYIPPADTSPEAPIQADTETADEKREDAKTFSLSSVTFLGDSTTAHMRQRAPQIDRKRIWCTRERYLNLDSRICNAKIEDPEGEGDLLITEAVASYRPRYLLITLGVDYGVYYYRDEPQKFRHCYERLLDALGAASPGTQLLIGSIFPVAARSQVITNEMIDRANGILRELAAARGLQYLDNSTVLKNEDGALREEYCSSEDGIHLTASAYKVILQSVEDQLKGETE